MVKLPKLKTLTKVLVAVAAAVIVILVIAATVNSYQDEQIQKTKQHEAAIAAAEQKGYERGTEDRTRYLMRYELQKLECAKGEKAYAALTASQKRLIKPEQVPNCSQTVLQ